MSDGPLTYRGAGVDRSASAALLDAARGRIRETFTAGVVVDLGHFGGMFHLTGYRDPVLVSTIDGVGSKVLVAAEAGRLEVGGRDAVVHGVNDVAVLGAVPLFALDYMAAARIDPEAAAAVLRGIGAACRDEGIALVGGETAQMPGVYVPQALDVVACVIGVVERERVCNGSGIRAGDALIGMASTGLHTNGYTLARAVMVQRGWTLAAAPDGLGTTLGEALLEPHRSYRTPLLALARAGWMRGAAHVTGGGIPGNLPRILPAGRRGRVDARRWPVPPIFGVLARGGAIAREEMFATFNMGVGMIVVTPAERAALAVDICRANGSEAWIIGEVVAGEPGVDLVD